jgi:RecB family endonuclease NucS
VEVSRRIGFLKALYSGKPLGIKACGRIENVTAIWHHDGTGWALLPPVGFPDEATLHALSEQAPQLLPLAGSACLVIVGREVQLGSGWADLVALEPSGRVVLIEIKLGHNAEARCAVVAQVLTYAASLYAMDAAAFGKS